MQVTNLTHYDIQESKDKKKQIIKSKIQFDRC